MTTPSFCVLCEIVEVVVVDVTHAHTQTGTIKRCPGSRRINQKIGVLQVFVVGFWCTKWIAGFIQISQTCSNAC